MKTNKHEAAPTHTDEANIPRTPHRLLVRCLSVAAMLFTFSAVAQVRPPTRNPGTPGGIINSPHNLSASGPGAIRATAEQQVCIFCHTPHNASPIQPLWNRNVPVNAYTVYSSTSLQAKPGQPTGSSKLCLSCHDGGIAVGSVLSREQPIQMAGGITTLPPGHSNLSTDLSDDHPISFRYDDALVARNPKLKPSGQFFSRDSAIRLDRNSEMQCTSCHDAHDNKFGAFLVMDNTNSQLCTSCHNPGVTTIAQHSTCNTCHVPHSAPSGPFLLAGATVADTCNQCHSGIPSPTQGKNIAAELLKLSRHDVNAPNIITVGAGTGDQAVNTSQVSCGSCHESHTMKSGTASAPLISPKLGEIEGVNILGAAVPRAQFTYEVCLKCHAENNSVKPAISRQVIQNNKRLQFSPSAVSYHPVAAAGRNTDVPSLVPGLTTASLIYCTDCHNSDTSAVAGSSGPNGPHGSNVKPLLVAPYETTDNTVESATAYALCYRCHERSAILNSPTFPNHGSHIVNYQTPCSVCHDAHGISSTQGNAMHNSALINFDTTVVQPDPVTGRLEYNRQGPRAGQCFLSCHGVPHSPLSYPTAAPMLPGTGLPDGPTLPPELAPVTPTVPQPAMPQRIRGGRSGR